MVSIVVFLLLLFVSPSISTISAGPFGGVRLTPGGSKDVATDSTVYVQGVQLLPQINTASLSGQYVPSLFVPEVNSLIIQYIPTDGITGAKTISIGTDYYLAIANSGNSSTGGVIMKWDFVNERFINWDTNLVPYPVQAVEPFFLSPDTFIAFAGFNSSVILKFNSMTGHFEVLETFVQSGTYDFEFFSTPSGFYLAEARAFTPNSSKIRTVYSNDTFDTIYASNFPLENDFDWESFTIAGKVYLALSHYKDSTGNSVKSVDIYVWDGITPFAHVQTLPAVSPKRSTSFTVGFNTFLAVAESGDGNTTQTRTSTIWQWNPNLGPSGLFQVYQTLPTLGAYEWNHFQVGGVDFLAIANYAAPSYTVSSQIYNFFGAEIPPVVAVTSTGATTFRSFTINGVQYLFVGNGNSQTTSRLNSCLYRITPA